MHKPSKRPSAPWKAGELRQRTERYLNGNPKRVETFDGNNGRQQHFWDNGQPRGDSPVVRCGQTGHQSCENGLVKLYFEDGTPRAGTSFRVGKAHGVHKRWCENGKPERVEEYADGKLLKSQRWDKDGKQLADNEYEADGSRKLKR